MAEQELVAAMREVLREEPGTRTTRLLDMTRRIFRACGLDGLGTPRVTIKLGELIDSIGVLDSLWEQNRMAPTGGHQRRLANLIRNNPNSFGIRGVSKNYNVECPAGALDNLGYFASLLTRFAPSDAGGGYTAPGSSEHHHHEALGRDDHRSRPHAGTRSQASGSNRPEALGRDDHRSRPQLSISIYLSISS